MGKRKTYTPEEEQDLLEDILQRLLTTTYPQAQASIARDYSICPTTARRWMARARAYALGRAQMTKPQAVTELRDLILSAYADPRATVKDRLYATKQYAKVFGCNAPPTDFPAHSLLRNNESEIADVANSLGQVDMEGLPDTAACPSV